MVNLSDVSLRTWNRIRITGYVWTLANIPVAPLIHEPPYAAIPMAIAAPVIGGVGTMCYRARLTRNRRELQAAQDAEHQREAKRDAELRRIAAPDPAPGQCPVCGLADLMELAQTDAFCGDTGGGPLAFTVPYGPVFAHFACAAVVPYEKYYNGTNGDMHHRGYHHAANRAPSGCDACGRERNAGTKDPYPAPNDCTCTTCRNSRGTSTVTTSSGTFAVEKPDESWRRFAEIEKYGIHGEARWACHYCSVACDASTFAHAEAVLREHAGKCPNRAAEAALSRLRATFDAIAIERPPQSNPAYGNIARLTVPEGPCYWKCHNCPTDGHSPNYESAESALREHARECMGRVEWQRAARIKSALAPGEPWQEWLRSAARSPDPGVREAAWAVLNQMRGTT